MGSNTIGTIFQLTNFGESHGNSIGGVIDGCPAGLKPDQRRIQHELERRKPGASPLSSSRKEPDKVELLSGLYEGTTTGAPIGFIIRNKDHRSRDYEHLKNIFRPSHADYTYFKKFGLRDHMGGGRASARVTACSVVGGAVARQLLEQWGVKIWAYTSQIGDIILKKSYGQLSPEKVYTNNVRCPDPLIAETMDKKIMMIKKSGDSIGGLVTCVISGLPAGIGEPVYNKLHAALAASMLSINAARGFEIGAGFESAKMKGSEHNDLFCNKDGEISTRTNYSGGIQGGISNGQDIYFRVAFKPTPSILKKQQTVNLQGNEVELQGRGRHDPCVVPRAVPVVEAMTLLTVADHFLLSRTSRL